MCGGVHYGEVEELVSLERWSCSRGMVGIHSGGLCREVLQLAVWM